MIKNALNGSITKFTVPYKGEKTNDCLITSPLIRDVKAGINAQTDAIPAKNVQNFNLNLLFKNVDKSPPKINKNIASIK